MADASSVRKQTTLPSPKGINASAIRYSQKRLWFSNGTEWLPLSVDAQQGAEQKVTWTQAAGATAAIYTVTSPLIFVGASESHATKSNTAGLTLNIVRDLPGGTLGAGTGITKTTFAATGDANTVQTIAAADGTVSASNPNGYTVLNPGDTISLKLSDVAGGLANVTVTLTFLPATAANMGVTTVPVTVTCTTLPLVANGVQSFFIADRPYKIISVSEVHGTAGGAGSTAIIYKDTGTAAPGAGTTVLAAATSFALDSTANIPVYPALSATASVLNLAAGDRLSYKLGATAATGYATPKVTVYLLPI